MDYKCVLETARALYKMPPRTRIAYEKTITRPELVEESTRAWALVKTLEHLPLGDTMEELRKQHPQFCSSYPIIVRYMVQMRAYSRGAVDKYLQYIEKNPWDTEEKFLEAQSKYVFYLMRALKPKMPRQEIFKIQAGVIDTLRKEASEFKTNVGRAKERADITEEAYARARREELIKMARAFPEQFTTMADRVILPDCVHAPCAEIAEEAADVTAAGASADELLL